MYFVTICTNVAPGCVCSQRRGARRVAAARARAAPWGGWRRHDAAAARAPRAPRRAPRHALLPHLDLRVQRRAAAGGACVLRGGGSRALRLPPHARARPQRRAAWFPLRVRRVAGAGWSTAATRLPGSAAAFRAYAQRLLARSASPACGRRRYWCLLGVSLWTCLSRTSAPAADSSWQGIRHGRRLCGSVGPTSKRTTLLWRYRSSRLLGVQSNHIAS